MRQSALIIGIANYPHNALTNPVNDANSMESAFKTLGIASTKIIDAGIIALRESFDKYIKDLQIYEVAIIYFAGHGLEISGENFLCAIDTDFSSENRIRYTALSLNYILDQLKTTNTYTKIIIIDACRDNPFTRGLRTVNSSTLAPVFAPLGSLIAFSTSPGQYALDGRDGNGAYTYSLLQHILVNDLKIEELFKRVRNTLYTLTSKAQVSWEHTSLMTDFYFSTSTLIGAYNSNYSNVALADETYNYTQATPIADIIRSLRSYNWYNQNTTINKINRIDINSANKDDLFVLGRNIYQAAIGNAWDVQTYLENINSNLEYFIDEARFHILNGIVFEIYFNKSGNLRDEFKSMNIDIVYNLLFDDKYKDSLHFIDSKLKIYDFRVVYQPANKNHIILNIVFDIFNEMHRVVSIELDGRNILYNHNGTSIWVPNDNLILITKEELQSLLIKKIGVPSYKLSIFYGNLPIEINRICVPFKFNLLTRVIRE